MRWEWGAGGSDRVSIVGISSLSVEILEHVLSFLGPSMMVGALCRMAMVSRSFAEISSSDSLWQPMCRDSWDSLPIAAYNFYHRFKGLSWKHRYLMWLERAVGGLVAQEDPYSPPHSGAHGAEKKFRFMSHLKVVLIGDSAVGKSTLAFRFANLQSPDQSTATPVALGQMVSRLVVREELDVKVLVTEIGGLDRFNKMAYAWYRGVNAIMVCYDVSNINSFSNVLQWWQEAERYTSEHHVTMLVGNKIDLESQGKREVSTAEGMKLARDLNSLFIETSALESLMVKEAFDLLIDSWLGSLWVKGVEQPRYLPSKEAARKLVMRKAGTSDDTQDKHKNCVVQ